MTSVGKMADVVGSNPSSGTYRYYTHDHLGSTRALWSQAKASLGTYEYTPYGRAYWTSAPAISHMYTGHMWDGTAQLYYAPYRYYSPATARWTTRDPLGMVDGPNMYAYVKGNPVRYVDPQGLKSKDCGCKEAAKRIYKEVVRNWPNPDRDNHMRHCVGICRLTKEKGTFCAMRAGTWNEIRPGGDFEWRDLISNRIGRKCGRSPFGCRACCAYNDPQKGK